MKVGGSADAHTCFPPGYVPDAVWKPDLSAGGAFGSINRPTAGARTIKELQVGAHPLQLYSLGTPNGQKVTILLEELVDLGRIASYDAWNISIMAGVIPLSLVQDRGSALALFR